MLYMIRLTSIVNHYVIKVDHHILITKRFKYLIHQPHKRVGSIRKSEWHDKTLIQPLLGFERRLSFVGRPNANLVIATTQINLQKYLSSTQPIQHVINARNMEPITNCNFINSSAVHTFTTIHLSLGSTRPEQHKD